MTRHVAFIRAINVAGHPSVRMTALCDAFESAGCRNVRSVIQSGNVLFDAPRPAAALFARVTSRVQTLSGIEPVIVTRTMTELARIVHAAPFSARTRDRTLKLYVVFLPRHRGGVRACRCATRRKASRLDGLSGRHAFVVSYRKPSGFYGFPNQFVEDALGVAATSRNWSTVVKIRTMEKGDC